MTVKISEYYDLFDIKITTDNTTLNRTTDRNLPNDIITTYETNPFRGFSNWDDFALANPNNDVYIQDKHKAPQGVTNIQIDDNGDILCFPPNVSVPYWNRIVFRNFDYTYNCFEGNLLDTNNKYALWLRTNIDSYTIPPSITLANGVITNLPRFVKGSDNNYYEVWGKNLSNNAFVPTAPINFKQDFTNIKGRSYSISDGSKVPLFLKFDEYRSRSKVIFSGADKTRNPDIEHKFGYQHGQMEPIKLNLGISCNNPITTDTHHYNWNLTRSEIISLLNKCYWSIEWIYERESGN